jgi:hypothetical protein
MMMESNVKSVTNSSVEVTSVPLGITIESDHVMSCCVVIVSNSVTRPSIRIYRTTYITMVLSRYTSSKPFMIFFCDMSPIKNIFFPKSQPNV